MKVKRKLNKKGQTGNAHKRKTSNKKKASKK